MPRIIRRPKKVCTVNKSGKKKCFTIQARRRLNPVDILVRKQYVINTISEDLDAIKLKLFNLSLKELEEIQGQIEKLKFSI